MSNLGFCSIQLFTSHVTASLYLLFRSLSCSISKYHDEIKCERTIEALWRKKPLKTKLKHFAAKEPKKKPKPKPGSCFEPNLCQIEMHSQFKRVSLIHSNRVKVLKHRLAIRRALRGVHKRTVTHKNTLENKILKNIPLFFFTFFFQNFLLIFSSKMAFFFTSSICTTSHVTIPCTLPFRVICIATLSSNGLIKAASCKLKSPKQTSSDKHTKFCSVKSHASLTKFHRYRETLDMSTF